MWNWYGFFKINNTFVWKLRQNKTLYVFGSFVLYKIKPRKIFCSRFLYGSYTMILICKSYGLRIVFYVKFGWARWINENKNTQYVCLRQRFDIKWNVFKYYTLFFMLLYNVVWLKWRNSEPLSTPMYELAERLTINVLDISYRVSCMLW